jgi:P-type Ca2+ transporter type 2C
LITPATTHDEPAVEIAQLPPEQVYEVLGSRPGGLTQDEVDGRTARYGSNRLPRPEQPSVLVRFGRNFIHVMAVLLWIAGAVAFVAGLPQLGIAIWVVNLINGAFSSWQEYKADKATEALQKLLPQHATVLRHGDPLSVAVEDVVPGDVLLLEEGDRVAADARLVEHIALRVDQSTLTGESRPVRKAAEACDPEGRARTELPNLVFAGTNVAAGRGRAVVSATGGGTEFGRVVSLTGGMTETLSPLQVEMKRVSYTVSLIAVGAGILFFVLALALGGLAVGRGFIFALGMIVAFVPEGLLPTVTLALAMGTQRMARRQAVVKRLSAVEALGSTTVICTDKTGTLTQNEMTVRRVFAGGREFEAAGVGYAPEGRVSPAPDRHLEEMMEVASLACNARLVPPAADEARWTVVGDPTEGAILVAARKAGIDRERISQRAVRLHEYPFDSSRKRMSTVNRVGVSTFLAVKGAPTELLLRCRSGPGGAPIPAEVGTLIERYGREGLRVIGVARRDLGEWHPDPESDPEEAEVDCEFLGLLAMEDPPRPEVAEAVEMCHRGGIRTVMITGDYGVTALTIGRRLGLVTEDATVISGAELATMDDSVLSDALEGEVLFARATPDQKLRVVEALQAKGHVVAVTGDGVNDAPALKRADIGVAMGRSGTDVAKEAADVVLLDDNFATIVAAVEEGRAVYANIRKFTTYILTSNTPEAVPFIFFAFSGGRIPLALDVMHILAIDLGTDLAPALALGAEPVEPGVMDQPPRRRSDHLIDRRLLLRAYVWLGPAQALAVMAAFFLAFRLAGFEGWLDLPADGPAYRSATAMALAMVVATQIGNLFAQRSERVPLSRLGLGGNRLLWWGIASEVVVILLIVYAAPFQRVIGTAPFPAHGWLWLLAGIPLLPLIDEIRKRITRSSNRKGN